MMMEVVDKHFQWILYNIGDFFYDVIWDISNLLIKVVICDKFLFQVAILIYSGVAVG